MRPAAAGTCGFVLDVLRTGCRRGSIPIQKVREIVDQVAVLPIRIDAAPPSPAALLALALRSDLSSYDANRKSRVLLRLLESPPVGREVRAAAECPPPIPPPPGLPVPPQRSWYRSFASSLPCPLQSTR